MNRNEWLMKNVGNFVGSLKVVKGEKGKTPIKGETKGKHWLFSDSNPAEERMKACIEHADSDPDNSIGLLLPDHILLVDLDNKDYSEDDGVARWKELSDIPATMKSSSGVGEHIWVQNPFTFSFKSNYSAVSGEKSDAAVELFGGSKQYIKLPDHPNFDWDSFDLSDLPKLPEGFLKGVTQKKIAEEVTAIDEPVAKFEVTFKDMFPLVALLRNLPHRPDLFAFLAAMKNLSVYHEIYHGDIMFAAKLKALAFWAVADMAVAGRYPAQAMWDNAKFLGKKGAGVRAIQQYSDHVSSPFGVKDSDKEFLKLQFQDFKKFYVEK